LSDEYRYQTVTVFVSSFKKATGISLHQYVIKQGVKRAKLLLMTTDLALANIASQVWFSVKAISPGTANV
jgi:transcriptional regulator GlxA family with amidase domain